MIEFVPYASSSKGNLFTVYDGETKLMIEAGIPWKKIQLALEFKTSEIEACLISHSHGDHSKSAKEVMKAGIDTYALSETFEEIGISSHRAKPIKAKEQFEIGSWNIVPFGLNHDVPNLGFLLSNRSGEKLIYITDSYYCKYRFKDLTVIAVECNHAIDILRENVANGSLALDLKNRLMESHFSLANVKEFLEANDLSKVQEIWLLHLSDGNSDADRFKREIQEISGKLVYVAEE